MKPALEVWKFGGASLADAAAISKAATLIAAHEGPLVVVCSALGGITDLLLGGGNNNFGWNVGGGIMLGSQHVAVRGDIRFIHAFDDFELLGIPLSDTDLDFGRASLGLFLSF